MRGMDRPGKAMNGYDEHWFIPFQGDELGIGSPIRITLKEFEFSLDVDWGVGDKWFRYPQFTLHQSTGWDREFFELCYGFTSAGKPWIRSFGPSAKLETARRRLLRFMQERKLVEIID